MHLEAGLPILAVPFATSAQPCLQWFGVGLKRSGTRPDFSDARQKMLTEIDELLVSIRILA
jgi:hypothetical protein